MGIGRPPPGVHLAQDSMPDNCPAQDVQLLQARVSSPRELPPNTVPPQKAPGVSLDGTQGLGGTLCTFNRGPLPMARRAWCLPLPRNREGTTPHQFPLRGVCSSRWRRLTSTRLSRVEEAKVTLNDLEAKTLKSAWDHTQIASHANAGVQQHCHRQWMWEPGQSIVGSTPLGHKP